MLFLIFDINHTQFSIYCWLYISHDIHNQNIEKIGAIIWTIDFSFKYGAFNYFIPYQETRAGETYHGLKLWAGIYK